MKIVALLIIMFFNFYLLIEFSYKSRAGQIIINNIFGGEKGKHQYRWKEVENSNIEYSNKGQIKDKKNVFIQNSTQNKKGKTSTTQTEKSQIDLQDVTETEKFTNTNKKGKYDYDFNRQRENKGDTISSQTENTNSINIDYSDYDYDSTAKNKRGNVLNDTGIVANIATNEDFASKRITNVDEDAIAQKQIAKTNNGKLEKENISNDYEKVF